MLYSFPNRRWCGTQSNAREISRYITSIFWVFSIAKYQSLRVNKSLVSHDLSLQL